MSAVRCLWLTEEQAERCPVDIHAGWCLAPADPVETAVDAYVDFDQRGSLEEQFTHVLRALGLEAPA